MKAFEAPLRARFEDLMVKHVLARSAVAPSLPADQVRAQVRRLIHGAEQHGIDDEVDIRRFIDIVFDHRTQALQNPEVAAALKSTGLSSSAKVAFIADALRTKGA